MTSLRTLRYAIRLIALVLFGAFMLVLATPSAAEPRETSAPVHVRPIADEILREGFDTATTEKLFCIRARFIAPPFVSPYVDTAFIAEFEHAGPKGVMLRMGFKCPDGWGYAHWHLDLPDTYPYAPSFQDMLFAAKHVAPFHMIVAPYGEYLAYGFGAELQR